jgi:YegS/Rv2252/BmrU family lipid kinase
VAAFRRADPGSRVELVRTEGPGHARRLAASAAEAGFDLVLAVGGDGTVHEAANGLVGSPTALGVAPAGTMNLLARVLGLPLDPAAAAARLAEFPATRRVRPGVVEDRAFLLMAGIGFDAWVLGDLLAHAGRKVRFRDYARGALRGLRGYPFPEMEVVASGRTLRGHSAVVGRAPLYGGFLRPTPRADLALARFEICVFSGGAASLARILPAMWSGDHVRREGVASVLADRAEVSAGAEAVPMQLDGEPAGTLPARFAISPREIRLAVGRPRR